MPSREPTKGYPRKIVLFANTDWYLFNYRLGLARHLRSVGAEVVMLSPGGEYGERLRAEGFRWEAVPMRRRSLNPLAELVLLAHLVRRLRHERPDVIHGFTIKCALYGALAGRAAGAPARIGAVAGLGYVFASDSPRARILRPMVRLLFRLAFGGPGFRLILQNPDDVGVFEAAGIVDPSVIRLIPSSGVDCERFKPRPCEAEEEASRKRSLRVILATRLLWEKGVGDFVEAARLLGSEGRSITFLLAGKPDPGNPGAVPAGVVQGWVDEGWIEWLGHRDDMEQVLSTVDVMVLPTYYREGVPRTLIDGAASGLALVTTDMPGCREVVRQGVEGFLVPPRDSGALARALARLDDDRQLVARFGRAARERATTEFDEAAVAKRTKAVYEEVVPRSQGTAARPGDQDRAYR